MPPVPIAPLIALASAASWGGGDFCGAMGVRAAGGSTTSALRFVVLSHSISFTVLLLMLLALRQPVPLGAPAVWAFAGGVAGGLGLTAFYIALSRGAMGAAAAVSGLLAAAIPAAVSSSLEGAPRALTLAGFAMAALAIWMVAAGDSPESTDHSVATLVLAACGGVGFGFYFVALKFAGSLGLVAPMALARAGSLVVCLLLLGVMAVGRVADPEKQILRSAQDDNLERIWLRWPLLRWESLRWALGVALLDTGGNTLFVAATRLGRLDVAAVLASLYPAGTILLAAWHLHERPTRRQLAGMAAALAAVVMITT
jgi:drug/metabolite transporter (DMT)-like permease